MKKGFYVSPDGKHVIQVCRASSKKMRHVLSGTKKNDFDIDTMWTRVIKRLFGSWEYLGI